MSGDWLADRLAEHGFNAEDYTPRPVGWPVTIRPDSPDWFIEQVHGTAPEVPYDGYLVPPGFTGELFQRLQEGFAAMDAWYDSHPVPAEPVPWHRRARSALNRNVQAWRDRAARRAYKTIAGDWPDDGPEDW